MHILYYRISIYCIIIYYYLLYYYLLLYILAKFKRTLIDSFLLSFSRCIYVVDNTAQDKVGSTLLLLNSIHKLRHRGMWHVVLPSHQQIPCGRPQQSYWF